MDSEVKKKTRSEGAFWNVFWLLLSSAGITCLSLLLAIGMFDKELFFDYFRMPLLFLLNYLPVLLLQVFLFCLLGRQWLAFLINSLFILLCSVGNFYKFRFRSEPFTFADLAMIKAGLSIAGNYDLTPNVRILLCIAGILCGTVFLAVLFPNKVKGFGKLIGIPVLLVFCVFGWKYVYSSSALYYGPLTTSDHVVTNWTQQEYAGKGFVYPFLYSIADSGKTKGQSAALSRVQNIQINDDHKIDLIVFQLEAFNDLRTLGILGISEDAYKIYDEIKKDSITGRLTVNVFAGGTIDTEHCVLTGEDSFRSVKEDAPSFVRWLSSQGYASFGNHPNWGAFYNRRNVNTYLGFDAYYYSEELYGKLTEDLIPSSWFSDCVLFPEVVTQYWEWKKDNPHVFSFNVTMQGHSPYNTEEYLFSKKYWDGKGYSSYADFMINNYLGSVVDTQMHLSGFLKEFLDDPVPIAVVFYGDHKPWLGDANCVADELGIDLNPSEEEGYQNRFTTEYVIWLNEAARKMASVPYPGKGKDVHASNLLPEVFQTIGYLSSSEEPVNG